MRTSDNRNTLSLETAAPVYGAAELVEGQAVLSLLESLDVESIDLMVSPPRAHGATHTPHVTRFLFCC